MILGCASGANSNTDTVPGGSSSGSASSGGSSGSGSSSSGAPVQVPNDGGEPPSGDGESANDANTDVVQESGPEGGSLNPNVAPGGNFDLSLWDLQEPTSCSCTNVVTVIAPSQLVGPNGFHDSYFFTDPADGSMTFWDPENGTATPGSSYPRCELRELTSTGAYASWQATGTNTLSATLKVMQVPYRVTVGQVHTAFVGVGMPTKPLLEIYYASDGSISLAIELDPSGGQQLHAMGNVPLGTVWGYVLDVSNNTITLAITGGANGPSKSFAVPSSFAGIGLYFKAGDYDQSFGNSSTVGAKVQFYALTLAH
jgi:hypothetical protein